jgi:acetolactate synthase-1/2/3 large subunit
LKVSDGIAKYLSAQVKHVFGVTGGCCVNIVDSICRQDGISYIPMHHEQAASYASDAYARLTGLGVCLSTAGPGATNLITGLSGSWMDSIPVLALVGQVPRDHMRYGSPIRQFGFQEIPTTRVFGGICKDVRIAHMPNTVGAVLSGAIFDATNGRKGPIVVEITDDTQHLECNEFDTYRNGKADVFDPDLQPLIDAASKAKRPVLIIGAGYHSVNLEKMVNELGWPVILTWGALDKLDHNHPLNFRDFGITGNWAGNDIVNDADFILALGARLDTHERGANVDAFATDAEKWVVDIHWAELDKFGSSYNTVLGDCTEIIEKIIPHTKDCIEWWNWCGITRMNCLPLWDRREDGKNNPYQFLKELSAKAPDDAIIISDAGQTVTWTMQAWKVKKGQRLFTQFNNSPMGYALPASIGAAYAHPDKQIICITGDGGLMMNIQELATIAENNIPIKIFVLNNRGYGMIRGTQDMYLEGRHYGTWNKGVGSIMKMMTAFGIPCMAGEDIVTLALGKSGPLGIDVTIDPNSIIEPKTKFGEGIGK